MLAFTTGLKLLNNIHQSSKIINKNKEKPKLITKNLLHLIYCTFCNYKIPGRTTKVPDFCLSVYVIECWSSHYVQNIKLVVVIGWLALNYLMKTDLQALNKTYITQTTSKTSDYITSSQFLQPFSARKSYAKLWLLTHSLPLTRWRYLPCRWRSGATIEYDQYQWRTVIGKLGYRTPTTFFLQVFMIVFNCRKVLFNR